MMAGRHSRWCDDVRSRSELHAPPSSPFLDPLAADFGRVHRVPDRYACTGTGLPGALPAGLTIIGHIGQNHAPAIMHQLLRKRLTPGPHPPIFELFRQRDYGDKRARNKRIGPGGGTRRLHQNSPSWRDNGAETGSTDV